VESDFRFTTNVVDVYINYLRRKVDDGFSLPLIHTVRGVGYDWARMERRHEYGASVHLGAHTDQAVLGELLHSLSQPLTSLRCSLELSRRRDRGAAAGRCFRALEQTDRVMEWSG